MASAQTVNLILALSSLLVTVSQATSWSMLEGKDVDPGCPHSVQNVEVSQCEGYALKNGYKVFGRVGTSCCFKLGSISQVLSNLISDSNVHLYYLDPFSVLEGKDVDPGCPHSVQNVEVSQCEAYALENGYKAFGRVGTNCCFKIGSVSHVLNNLISDSNVHLYYLDPWMALDGKDVDPGCPHMTNGETVGQCEAMALAAGYKTFGRTAQQLCCFKVGTTSHVMSNLISDSNVVLYTYIDPGPSTSFAALSQNAGTGGIAAGMMIGAACYVYVYVKKRRHGATLQLAPLLTEEA